MERKMEENETFFANRRKSKNKRNGIFVMNVTFITSTVGRKERNVVENSNSLVKIAMIEGRENLYIRRIFRERIAWNAK